MYGKGHSLTFGRRKVMWIIIELGPPEKKTDYDPGLRGRE
jgi:hypothetical protein